MPNFDLDGYLSTKISSDLIDKKLEDLAVARQTKVDMLTRMHTEAVAARKLGIQEHNQIDLGETAADVGIKLAQGAVDLGAGVVGLSSLATGGAIGQGMRAIGYDPAELNRILGEKLSSGQRSADAKVQNADGFVDTVTTSLANPRSIIGGIAESLPAMLAGMGVSGMAARGIATQAAMATAEGRAAAAAMTAAGKADQAGLAAMSTQAGAKAGQAAIEAAGFRLSALGAGTEGAQTAGNIADQAQAAGREYSDYALPSLAAGAGTAAIGMVSNKVFGDAGTDLATGSKTLTGSKLARIGKEAFSEGITEEMPQSAQEQVFTNMAMGEQDLTKGVGNAAGSGLVVGAAMGGGMGVLHGGEHATAKLVVPNVPITKPTEEMKQKVAQATESNDITDFITPGSKTYDLTKGMEVLVGHAMKDTTSDEVKQSNLKQAGELLSKIEEQHAAAKNEADTFSPASINEAKGKIAQYEAELAKVDTTNNERVNQLTDFRDGWKDVLTDATNKDAANKANTALSRLERQLTMARTYMDNLSNVADTPASAGDVTALVDQTTKKDTAAASRLINLSMTQPEVLSPQQAMKLVNDKNNALTPEQRDHLRVFSQARLAQNAVSTQSKVAQEVMFGSDKNLGLSQYRSRIATAIAADNQAMANKQLALLDNFAASHEGKATTAERAIRQFGMGAQIVKTEGKDGKWVAHPVGAFSGEAVKKNGGLILNSPRLVVDIKTEAAALRAAHTEMKSAIGVKFAVQSKSSTQNTPPSQNINSPKNEEDTARPELRSEPLSVKSPPATQATKEDKADKAASSTIQAASPASKPASLAVADAPAATVSSSAPAAKQVTAEQPTKDGPFPDSVVKGVAYHSTNENPNTFVINTERDAPELGGWMGAKGEVNKRIGFYTTQNKSYSKAFGQNTMEYYVNITNPYLAKDNDEIVPTQITPEQRDRLIAQGYDGVLYEAPKYRFEEIVVFNVDQVIRKDIQQAAVTEQQAVVSEANPAPAAEVVTPAEEDTSPISALNDKAGADAPYNKKRLGDLFTQSKSETNPLASVKNFISTVKTIGDLREYLPGIEGKLNNFQVKALTEFKRVVVKWLPAISANIFKRPNQDYAYTDMMNYFIKPDGDIDENVKTAITYAAYSYVVENARGSRYNTNEQIGKMLGAGKDYVPNKEERDLLGTVIGHQTVLTNQLGQRVLTALGLRAKPGTPQNIQSQMAGALGAHVLRLLVDGKNPIMRRKFIRSFDLDRIMKKKDRGSFEDTPDNSKDYSELGLAPEEKEKYENYIEFNRDASGELSPAAKFILDSARDSGGVVNDLFAVESPDVPPTFSPVEKMARLIKRSKQEVPKYLNRVIKDLNSQENFLRQDKQNLRNAVGDDAFLRMMGWVEPDPLTMHAGNLRSREAKNAALERELANMDEFVNSYLEPQEQGLDQPFFFSHYATRQQRVMVNNKLVNPQASKLQRFSIFRKSWATTVDRSNMEQMDNFWLRAAEGLGVKTEKLSKAAAIAKVKATVATPAMQAAIAAAGKAVKQGATLTNEEKEALVAGVGIGGEAAHSLDALVGLAEEAKGAPTFNVTMLSEVDGVTNGPMLSHLLLGAADSVEALFAVLNRGGFYRKDSGITEFNQWRSAAGARDLYENISLNMQKSMAWLLHDGKVDAEVSDHISFFLGDLGNIWEDRVEKAGRDLVKTPITAVSYSSSLRTAINEGMVSDLVDSIYKKIEKLAQAKMEGKDVFADYKQVVKAMQGIGIKVDSNASIDELMATEFSRKEIAILTDSFSNTFGKAVSATLYNDFGPLMERRRLFTKVAGLAYGIYNAAYKGMRDAYVKEQIKEGKIAADGKGNPIHDLTEAQEAELDERMAALTPVLQTAMSNRSGGTNSNSGMLVAKSERKLNNSAAYKSEVKFATPFADNGNQSTMAYGSRIELASPGVSMDANSTQSFDSAVMHTSMHGQEVLGLHDAKGVGIHQVQEAGRTLNEAVWQNALYYSPAQEMYNTYVRVVTGLDELLNSESVPAVVVENIAKELVQQSEASPEYVVDGKGRRRKGPPISEDHILLTRAQQMKIMAENADRIKLGAMAEMETISQYAVEGGAYSIDQEQRDIAKDLVSKLTPVMDAKDQEMFQRVQEKLLRHVKAARAQVETQRQEKNKTLPPKSPFGELGKPVITADASIAKWFKANPERTVTETIAFMKTHTGLTSFQRMLLSAMGKSLAQRGATPVRMITANTQESAVAARSDKVSMGWFHSKDGVNEINLLGPEFQDSGLTVELVLHELLHAAIAEAINYPSPEAASLVSELDALRLAAKIHAQTIGAKGFTEAFSSVDEFVSYGMTSARFQNEVLATLQYETKNKGNTLLSGLTTFVNKLVALVFTRENATMSSGMEALVTNVAGLMKDSSTAVLNDSRAINLAMATPGNVRDLTTSDIYHALSQSNNGAQVSNTHGLHLQNLLNTVVRSVYGPFGVFKDALMKQTAQDPIDVYTEALQTGQAPFASESLAAGFAFTDQEAFVLEQVEATLRTALASNDGVMTIAYKELTKLYSEVRAKVTVESLHDGDWATATQTEKDQAQALYDFVFTIKQDASGKSDYMSRFAALGLVHEGFRKQLKFDTALASTDTGMSFNARLNKIFNTIMGWVAGKLTDTFRGQRADAKLMTLVQQMIQIEAKRRDRVTSKATQAVNSMQATAEDLTAKVRKEVEAFGKKPFFQDNRNAFVKLAGNTLSAVAGDRVDGIMEAYLRLRDKTMTGQLGVAAALVNEIRGSTDLNKVFHFLLRGTKHIEGIRKDTISRISQVVTGSFANGGDDLSNEHKASLTAVVLRGDMQSLLGPYTVAQLQNLVDNRKTLQSEIDQHEQQLTGNLSRFYINSAKALGFFLATGKITVAHQLFNAGNIARLLGTGKATQAKVNEAEATTATPVIDRLASLYAIKYSRSVDLKRVSEVFKTEAARTDGGHGIEMILKTHHTLQAESKDKLFAGSEALQMKGYVPEIYDPYMSVVMANDDEGAELLARGYVATPGYLGQDNADPVSDRKRIYSLRDGGMKQWNSGIFSLSRSSSKGSKVVGNAHPVSVAGQQNAQTMAAIRAGKRTGIQAMFSGANFDPTMVDATHMAPVLDPSGNVTNYRYMMSNQVKDKLLNRDNRTDHLLGSMAGTTFDKVASKVQNSNAVKALHTQYKEDFAAHPEAYLTVGPSSTDPQLREIWHMLPRDAQQEAIALFGRDGMKVRNDVLDMNFGYRKLSIGTVFDKEAHQRNFVERMFVEIMTHAFKDQAQLRTRQAEDIWQAIVKETKANLVVKSWSTMTGNLRSNWSQLYLMGVSPMAILNSHRVAFKSAWEYKQDSHKLFELQHQLRIKHFAPGMTEANATYQVKRLEDSLARNPIRPLIDAGLMPTIVEDVGVDEDIYSYKSRFTKKIDDTVDAINPHILEVGKYLTMHHSTAPYKVMSYATQISDFLARYTLYQHDIKTMTHEQAVQRASDAFINYDVPTHRKIQYANDSGLIMFSKYYVRIQKILGRIYKDSPARVMGMIAAEHMIGDQPTVLDSSFVHHIGNPFNAGALSYFSSLDSVTTVAVLTGPFTSAVYNGQ